MNDQLLTYRFPRTLAEAAARHPCTGEDAPAIQGPYKRVWDVDTLVAWFCVCALAIVCFLVIAGVI